METYEKKQGYWVDLKQSFRRCKRGFSIVLSLLAVFLITVQISNFFRKTPTKFDSKMLDQCMEYINKEMDRILLLETRTKQNKEFRNLKTDLPLKPVRMSLTTAVFVYTHTSTPVVLKRIIWNKKNGLNEDETCTIFKGKSKYLVNALMSTRTTRLINSPEDSDTKEKQTLIWIFFEFMDIKINDDHVGGDERVIRKILRDALKGLKYMHDHNYAHLDIKIANIMGSTNSKGEIIYKLIDFGYTQHFSEKMAVIPKKNYGTYPFKAPEVIKKSIHGTKSDIWALGATAWYLSLSNILFYDEDGNKDDSAYAEFINYGRKKYKGNNKHRFTFRKETSPELRHFITTTMDLDWKARPTVDQLLRHPFIQGKKLTNTLTDSYSVYESTDSGYSSDTQ